MQACLASACHIVAGEGGITMAERVPQNCFWIGECRRAGTSTQRLLDALDQVGSFGGVDR
jgi:hypothetical protein